MGRLLRGCIPDRRQRADDEQVGTDSCHGHWLAHRQPLLVCKLVHNATSARAMSLPCLHLLMQDGCFICVPDVHDTSVIGTRLHLFQAGQHRQ